MQSAKALYRIFKLTLNKDIGLQLWTSLLSLSFFQLVLLPLAFRNYCVNAELKLDTRGVLRYSFVSYF